MSLPSPSSYLLPHSAFLHHLLFLQPLLILPFFTTSSSFNLSSFCLSSPPPLPSTSPPSAFLHHLILSWSLLNLRYILYPHLPPFYSLPSFSLHSINFSSFLFISSPPSFLLSIIVSLLYLFLIPLHLFSSVTPHTSAPLFLKYITPYTASWMTQQFSSPTGTPKMFSHPRS